MGHMIEPSEFDLVVIGTGLIESIVAAAASKAGHSVLQVDPASHYGGAWASLRLDELQAALENTTDTARANRLGDELAFILREGHVVVRPVSPQLLESPHLYSLDVSPHLLYGAGPMISLLLGSGAHHYTEYKLLQGTVLRNSDSSSTSSIAQPVPSTRAEIFRDKTLSPLQKRTLMRFIKGLAEAMEGKGPFVEVFSNTAQQEKMLFKEFMEQEGLDIQLQRCLAHGVLLQHNSLLGNTSNSGSIENLTCSKALELFKLYIESVGRYGIDAGPFLTPLYGCGELPQAFCRSAAVSGAVQILRCHISDLLFDEEAESRTICTGVEIEIEDNSKQIIKAGKVAAGPSVLAKCSFSKTETVVTHRCIAILDGPVEVDKAQALLVFPEAGPGGSTVWALQLSHRTAVCPEGQLVLHLWCAGGKKDSDKEQKSSSKQGIAEKYLIPCLESLADCSPENKDGIEDDDIDNNNDNVKQQPRIAPRVLFAACFSVKSVKPSIVQQDQHSSSNIVLCSGPSADVTFALAVEQAKKVYWQLFPPTPQPGGENSEKDIPLFFPLDEAVVRAEEHTSAGDNNEEQGAGGNGGAGGAANVEVDSDDEALEALKAALELLPSS